MQNLFRIISQTQPESISTKNGTMQKSTIVLQETGSKYADTYVATMLGNQSTFYAGELVWAALRFQAHNYNGSTYMDCTIQDIIKFTN